VRNSDIARDEDPIRVGCSGIIDQARWIRVSADRPPTSDRVVTSQGEAANFISPRGRRDRLLAGHAHSTWPGVVILQHVEYGSGRTFIQV